MATDRDPTFEEKPIGQPPAYSPATGRVEPLSGGRVQATSSSGLGLGTILTSCVLALVMGCAGAWAYMEYLGPMLAKRQAWPTQNAQTATQNTEANSSDTTNRLNDLSGKIDALQERVDRLPKAAASQDVEQLREKIAVLDDVSRKVDALGVRVNSLPGKVDQDNRKITSLAADLQGMRIEVASLRNNIQTTPPGKSLPPRKDHFSTRTRGRLPGLKRLRTRRTTPGR